MDELQLVRDLFDEPALPRPEVTIAARARLTGGDTRPRTARPRTAWPRAGRRFSVPVAAPIGAAAAVTAVAVVLALLPHGPSAPTGGAPASGGPLTTGRYWVQPGVVGNYLRVGSAGDRYVVLERVAVQRWTPLSKLVSPAVEQPLSVTPASPADMLAWRAAGSPAVWTDTGQDTSIASPQGYTEGFSFPLKAGHGKPTAAGVTFGTGGFYWFGRQLSARQLHSLSASPAALKQLLYKQFETEGPDGSFASYLVSALPPLMSLPVTTSVRSALYQVLARLPGVEQLSSLDGKRVTALAVTGHYTSCGSQISLDSGSGLRATFSSCGVQQVLIVSPATWLPVEEELRYTSLPPGQSWSAPDGLFSYELFGTSYWTSAKPPVT
jgi:hypothetical protein